MELIRGSNRSIGRRPIDPTSISCAVPKDTGSLGISRDYPPLDVRRANMGGLNPRRHYLPCADFPQLPAARFCGPRLPPCRIKGPDTGPGGALGRCFVAWVYKGLTTAVKLLESTNHPRAAEFAQEAQEYKAAFLAAYRAKQGRMAEWTGPDGKMRHLVPHFLSQEQDWQQRHLFYLDGGPLSLVWGGLMDANDPSMQDAVYWFREGPPKIMGRVEHDLDHMPFLRHEVSSWEVCYSWNVFHTWQLGDRRAVPGGDVFADDGRVLASDIHRLRGVGGMMATTNWIPTVLHLRNAVVDDWIRDGELHLLRMCPLAWLSSDSEAKFLNMPTCFGPVDLRAKLADGGKTLAVSYAARFRNSPSRVVLHVPPLPDLQSVTVNGEARTWDAASRSMVVE